MYILGLSCFYHDSAAVLVKDGDIIAAAQEERFTRKKHDASFPKHAIEYCLKEAGISISDISHISFYEKPIVKFDRILQIAIDMAPRGFPVFMKVMPLWLKDRIWVRRTFEKEFEGFTGSYIFPTHHESHAASAFYPSPFERAAVLTLDAVGEWHTTTYGVGDGSNLTLTKSVNFPHSLGMLYSAFTYYIGFRVNTGEYKLMGLAPYGTPRFKDLIYRELVTVNDDGSFRLNMKYFGYGHTFVMTNAAFEKLFGKPVRKPETPMDQHYMDVAASIQEVTEEIVLKIAKHVRNQTNEKHLCLAGGVSLNCVANAKILQAKIFDDIWIQPAAGDAGGALGAALFVWYKHLGKGRKPRSTDSMRGAYLGPIFTDKEVENELKSLGAKYHHHHDGDYPDEVAKLLEAGKVVGWFQGRMEFGPRALGGRSIIGDPRNREMQTTMNLKIKFRESFRPFAPSVLDDDMVTYFNHANTSPYMLLTFPVKEDQRLNVDSSGKSGLELLNLTRSKLPAITHVDYSARVQTSDKRTNPKYDAMIRAFKKRTGCGMVVNTSFNVRGEPIVCTPGDAWRCFMRTNMDALAIGPYILLKSEQPEASTIALPEEKFELD